MANDFRVHPMDFIIHNYQMSDLLSIATIFTSNRHRCFEYQMERFQYFIQMQHVINKFCPQLHAMLQSNFHCDLNEILLDLYAINIDRCANYDDSVHEAMDNNDCGGDDHPELQIITKLNELHAMTQRFLATIKP